MKTAEVVEIIKNILNVIDASVEIQLNVYPAGGNHDTENIVIQFQDEKKLFVCGFSGHLQPLNDTTDWSTNNIEYIELTDGEDSSGGLTHDEGDIVTIYHKLRKKFRDLNYEVVNKIDDYF